MNRIGQMVELVREAVTAPGINQRRGTWTPRGDCCMGSRIGHQLGLDPAAPYMEGVDEWAQLMGVNRAEVIAMLQDAGAGHDPLGAPEVAQLPRGGVETAGRLPGGAQPPGPGPHRGEPRGGRPARSRPPGSAA